MKIGILTLAVVALAPAALGGCVDGYGYGPPPPPPPGAIGEGWARHVVRCEHRFRHYDPKTDLVYRRGGTFRCPL